MCPSLCARMKALIESAAGVAVEVSFAAGIMCLAEMAEIEQDAAEPGECVSDQSAIPDRIVVNEGPVELGRLGGDIECYIVTT